MTGRLVSVAETSEGISDGRVYCAKTRGTKDREFAVYAALLEEIGIDLSRVPRTEEPGTDNRWLYVWKNRVFADRFRRELVSRTRDRSWELYEFEMPVEEVGPLVPLEIIAMPTGDGTEFRLTPSSQDRIMRRFPNAHLAGESFWGTAIREDYQKKQGPIWNQVAIRLASLSQQQFQELGGYRVVEADSGTVLYDSRVQTS